MYMNFLNKIKVIFFNFTIFLLLMMNGNYHIICDEHKTPLEALYNDFVFIKDKIISTLNIIKEEEKQNESLFKKKNFEQNKKIDDNTNIYISKENTKITLKYIKSPSVYDMDNYSYTFSKKINSTGTVISEIFFSDNSNREYSYLYSRGAFEIAIKNKDYSINRDKKNNLRVRLANGFEYERTNYGTIKLSKDLINNIYHLNNEQMKEIIFQCIQKDFPQTEYAAILRIFLENDFKSFITKSINHYRETISEENLEYNTNLEKYADHRLTFFIDNMTIPNETNKYESPYLNSFAGIDEQERSLKYNIKSNIYEIASFYSDPISFIISLMENLNQRAKLLSLTSYQIGVSYSEEFKLLVIIIEYEPLNKNISRFRIFPPHNSVNVRLGVESKTGSIKGYPISLHIDGEYNLNSTELYNNDGLKIDITSGNYYEKDTKYAIASKIFDENNKYRIKFPFNNIEKPIRSFGIVFSTMRLDEFDDFNITDYILN